MFLSCDRTVPDNHRICHEIFIFFPFNEAEKRHLPYDVGGVPRMERLPRRDCDRQWILFLLPYLHAKVLPRVDVFSYLRHRMRT